MTVDYDFWVRPPERGTIRAQTLYELSDGTQANASFQPDGLRSFQAEWERCSIGRLEGVPLRILPLARVIASKRAAGRDKDLAALPVLERTLRLAKRLKTRKQGSNNPPGKRSKRQRARA